jgi:hypothetical protein
MNYVQIGSGLVILGTIVLAVGGIQSDREVSNIKDYSLYATMNIFGDDRLITGGKGISVTFHSPLYDKMNRIVETKNDLAYIKTDRALIPTVDSVIKEYPKFPFGYYAKALILRNNGNDEWIEYAEKAKKIFSITTTIEGHSPGHDQALAELTDLLNQTK